MAMTRGDISRLVGTHKVNQSIVAYREAYGIYACNGILFNHENPRCGETFVTRTITRGLANISQSLDKCLYMGNMSSLMDWGRAKDYVHMQWLMHQQEQPKDFVIATRKQYSVRDFIRWIAAELGIELRFEGEVLAEKGVVDDVCGSDAPFVKVGDILVQVDPRYFRPTEVHILLGDATHAKTELEWEPEISVQVMCKELVLHDLNQAKREALLRKHGYNVCMSHEN